MDDLTRRQDAINTALEFFVEFLGGAFHEDDQKILVKRMNALPSVEPEQLTDKEQRIFLAAMGREEKVCKQVDDECRDCREPYEDSLVRTCHEITRKVKGALWA